MRTVAFRTVQSLLAAWLICVFGFSRAIAWVPTSTPAWDDGLQVLYIGLNAQDRFNDGHTAASTFQEAVSQWNERIQRLQMNTMPTAVTTASAGDRINSVVMASTIYGTDFGENVLAATTSFRSGGKRVEADITFNSKYTWSSYRGSYQRGTPDLQRVALHELGHFLGLGHPDEAGQQVNAIMNSMAGNLNLLMPDDRLGGAMLYGLRGSNEGLIPDAIAIIANPGSMPAVYGESVTLFCYGNGVGTLQYQWFKDGVAIPGASGTQYRIPSVTAADVAHYTVSISNEIGSSLSPPFHVSVSPPILPQIRAEAPNPQTYANEPLSFTGVVLWGSYPMTVRIERDGVVIAESVRELGSPRDYTWSRPAADSSHTGKYVFHCSNAAGTVSSQPIEIIVSPSYPPRLLDQHSDHFFFPGESVSFSPSYVEGGRPPTIHWTKDGVSLGAFGVLSIREFGPQHVGNYTFTLSNHAGSTEGSIFLGMLEPKRPWFKFVPESHNFYGHLELFCEISGTPPFHYEWKHNGRVLDTYTPNTSNSSRFRIDAPKPEHAGEYTVTVSNSVGSITSAPATMVYDPAMAPKTAPFQITRNPGSVTVRPGSNPFFTIEVSKDAVQVQWYKDDQLLAGKNGYRLQLGTVGPTDAGLYHAVATSLSGSQVSRKAQLIVDSSASTRIESVPGDILVPWNYPLSAALGINWEGPEMQIKWFRFGSPWMSSNPNVLTIEKTTFADEGEYYAEVTSGGQTVRTASFRVTVIPPEAPQEARLSSLTAEVGAMITLAAPDASNTISHFQWKKGGVEIAGATSQLYRIDRATYADAGDYSVVRTNPSGSAEAVGGRVTIIPGNPPFFKQQLGALWRNLAPGFSYQVVSETPVTYLWKKGGVSFAEGAPTPNLWAMNDFSGVYTLVATNGSGSTESKPVVLVDRRHQTNGLILAQPLSQTVTLGSIVNLNFDSIFFDPPHLWKKNGVDFTTTIRKTLPLNRVTPEDSGIYSVTLRNPGHSLTIESLPAHLRVLPYGRLYNLSSRSLAGSDNATLIAGFIVAGSVPKQVLIRGIGPALDDFGVKDFLPDPKLTLYDQKNIKIAEINAWDLSQREEIEGFSRRLGAFALDPAGKDVPVLITLAPGSYTAHLTAASGASQGVGLIEVYDCIPDASRLINISTRTWVGSGSNVLISGFVVEPGAPKKILIRAAGPALEDFKVDGILADPELEIVAMGPEQSTVARNDNWHSSENAAEVVRATAAVGAFAFAPGSRDAAILVTLPPGGYTAIVSGRDGTTGVALVEVYEVVD